jgi:hypothetical protein
MFSKHAALGRHVGCSNRKYGYIFMLRARNILITSFIIDSTDVIYTENMLHGRHSVISIIDVVGVMAL